MTQKQLYILPKGTFVLAKYRKMLMSGIMIWIVSLVDSNADTFIAGLFINEDAVSGVELVSPFFSILTFIAYLIAMGTAIMYSRECGKFNYRRAYGFVGQGIICSVIAAVVLVVAMIVLREPLMDFYDPTLSVRAYANEYYTYQLFFAVMYPIFYVFAQLVTIDGDEIISVAASATMAGVNLVASLLLVREYGVKGIALGTVFGATSGFAVYCIHFLRKTNSIHIKFHFSLKDVWQMVKLSSGTSVTLLYVAIIDIVMNKFVIIHFGDEYLPAYVVINFVLNLGALFTSTFDAASGFVSVSYGEDNLEEIKKVMTFATFAVLAESVIAAVVMEFVAPFMPTFYGITDTAVAHASVYAARVVSISFPAIGLYYLYCAYYPAVNFVLLGNIATVLYMLVMPIAVAMPLGVLFGFEGLSWGFMLTSVITIIIIVVLIWQRYGVASIPLLLPKTATKTFAYDMIISPENVSLLCQELGSNLSKKGLPDRIINEAELVVEESYMTIMEANAGKKILTECNVLLSDKNLRVILRDNGKIFDIAKESTSISYMRSFMLARLIEHDVERSYVTTISFDRNSYMWQLEQ